MIRLLILDRICGAKEEKEKELIFVDVYSVLGTGRSNGVNCHTPRRYLLQRHSGMSFGIR